MSVNRLLLRRNSQLDVEASSSLNHHPVILSPPLFVFSPSHVRFLLMALIEGRGYFSNAGEGAAAAAVGKVEAKEEAAKS